MIKLPLCLLALAGAFVLYAVLPVSADPAAPAAAGKEAMTKPQDLSKLSTEELKKHLTPLQCDVCRLSFTEPPFKNAYWNHHEPGIYVDVISGEALFSSTDKFDSGTGWPSFVKTANPDQVVEKKDGTAGMIRTEVIAKKSEAHLGHVFDDGPKPTGLRYCINSASLRFVPVAKLEEFGYGKYLPLFEKKAEPAKK